jgi:hypothetical protein
MSRPFVLGDEEENVLMHKGTLYREKADAPNRVLPTAWLLFGISSRDDTGPRSLLSFDPWSTSLESK